MLNTALREVGIPVFSASVGAGIATLAFSGRITPLQGACLSAIWMQNGLNQLLGRMTQEPKSPIARFAQNTLHFSALIPIGLIGLYVLRNPLGIQTTASFFAFCTYTVCLGTTTFCIAADRETDPIPIAMTAAAVPWFVIGAINLIATHAFGWTIPAWLN